MKFDEVLKVLGEFGRYQWFAFFFLHAVNFVGPFSALSYVFYTGKTDHWCKVFDKPNCTAYGLNTVAECNQAMKAVSIPPAPGYPEDAEYSHQTCRQYDLPKGLQFSPDINYTDYNASIVDCKRGWEYDTSQYNTTIIMDWDLVCTEKGTANMINSIFFFGFMAGSFVFGVISDWFGRKNALIVAMLMWFLGLLATPFCSELWHLYLVRFITGMGQLGRWIPAYVMVNEFVGQRWRIVVGVLIGVSYSLGYMLVAIIAMYIDKWRVLAFIPVIPVFLCIILTMFLSESVRWLLSKGRVKEAEDVIRKVGKWNGKKLPDVIFEEKEILEFKEGAKGRLPSFIDLYRTPNMCFKTIILQYNWMVNSMVYYGLSLSTGDLGVDDYWAFFIAGAVEIPALLYATVGIRWFGRKPNMVVLELIGGAACLATIFIESSTAKTVVAMVGKFCITATFNTIYLWTSEMFPTPVRTVAIGMCSVAARVGGIVAPLMLNMADVIPNLHLIVFGIVTIVAGVSLIPLPETNGKKLPETMAEGEEFGKFACMKKWAWGSNTYKTDDDDDDVVMEMGTMETVNPAYVPDVEDPSSRPENEKSCQFPERPRKRSKKTGSEKKGHDQRPEDQVKVQDPGSEKGTVTGSDGDSDGEGIDL
ncbi:solute carrier family 22 member 4-like [Asterias amurensis]|uniref:solute carrier family 22 member 4-like n=1 Tax=Asterias amurensis TaxID=7602 RepID=UPI003AB72CEB